uniref:Uncharacterized protein n=1 Tax=Caenorhabditis japonica TaxID=281687 RepID=A0A8R1IQS0_CAEJA
MLGLETTWRRSGSNGKARQEP